MLKTTDPILTRLIALREECFPLAFEAEKAGHLDFDIFVSRCGTYRCLQGFWLLTDTAKADGWTHETGGGRWKHWRDSDATMHYFGLTDGAWCALFGMAYNGDLHTRLAYLDRLITARIAA